MTAYTQALLTHIETIDAELDWVLSAFPPEWLHHRVGEEWSVHEALAHLRDVEVRAYAPRIQALAAEDGAAWANFEGAAWHREHYQPTEPLNAILIEFRGQRAMTLATLRTLTPEQWRRTGMHEGTGSVTMEYLAERLYWHTLEHITQVVGNRQMLAVGE